MFVLLIGEITIDFVVVVRRRIQSLIEGKCSSFAYSFGMKLSHVDEG